MLSNHHPSHLANLLTRLDRVQKYLANNKLRFRDDVLELNPAPFMHADQALPTNSPLTYITLFMRETCWSLEDLESRQIMVEALKLWLQNQLDLTEQGN